MVVPRQVAMYLTRTLTDTSLPAIGKAFGGKDHSTVLHACKKVEEKIADGQVIRGACGGDLAPHPRWAQRVSGHLLENGLVSVYTGPGRGKTTAALGLALRVLGWGGRVCVVQFIKGYPEIGEAKFAADFGDRFELRQFAVD